MVAQPSRLAQEQNLRTFPGLSRIGRKEERKGGRDRERERYGAILAQGAFIDIDEFDQSESSSGVTGGGAVACDLTADPPALRGDVS